MAELKVDPGDATGQMVQEAWVEVLAEISEDGEARKTAEAYGADPDALATARDDVSIKDEQGDFGLSLVILIGAPVATEALKGLWNDLVRPRIRDKFNRDAGPPRD
jgi:hypothetical protein